MACSTLRFTVVLLSVICLAIGIPVSTWSADNPLAAAYTAAGAGDLDGAIAGAQQTIAGSQDRAVQASGYLLIGYLQLRKQDAPAAAASFGKVVSDYSDQRSQAAEAQTRIAYSLDKSDKAPEAIAAFQKIVTDFSDQKPRAAEAYLRIGNCHLRLKQIAEAEVAYKKAIELTDANPVAAASANLRLVVSAFGKAKAGSITYAEFEQMAQAALQKFPKDAQIQSGVRIPVASAYMSQDKPLLAIEAARGAIKAVPGEITPNGPTSVDMVTTYDKVSVAEQVAWARFYITTAQYAAGPGFTDSSIAKYRALMQECSAFSSLCSAAQYRIAEALFLRKKQIPEALAEYKKLAEAYAGSSACAWAEYRMGECYAEQKNYVEAIARWKSAVIAGKSNKTVGAYAVFKLFDQYYRTGDYATAVGETTAIDSTYSVEFRAAAKGMKLLGLFAQRKLSEAVTLGRELVADTAYKPTLPMMWPKAEIQYNTAMCLFMQKDYDTAITEARKVSTMSDGAPFAAVAAVLVGDCHRAAGRLTEASAAYAEVVAGYPTDKISVAKASYLKAVCLYDAQKLSQAQTELQAFLTNCSADADAESINKARVYLSEIESGVKR